jgi:Protein of unknown function (DUF3619)
MNTQRLDLSAADLFGRRVSVHLDQANQSLPYDISERLRAASHKLNGKPLPNYRLKVASCT